MDKKESDYMVRIKYEDDQENPDANDLSFYPKWFLEELIKGKEEGDITPEYFYGFLTDRFIADAYRQKVSETGKTFLVDNWIILFKDKDDKKPLVFINSVGVIKNRKIEGNTDIKRGDKVYTSAIKDIIKIGLADEYKEKYKFYVSFSKIENAVREDGTQTGKTIAQFILINNFNKDNVTGTEIPPGIVHEKDIETLRKTAEEAVKERNEFKQLLTGQKPPPLHRQARGYMKTTARLVGKDMSEERSLFTLPSYDYDTRALKDTLSKNTAITGNLLLALWQKNRTADGIYTIDNLSSIASLLNITPQELKIYLIYLGGYQYPVVKYDETTKILSVYHDKLFFVKFNMRLKEGENEKSFTNDDKIGNNYVSFIRDRNIDSIDISPSKSLIEELQGKGLGNVLVDDTFVAFCLGLSELAYKLFCFSGSNKPSFKIGFKKLISKKYLNLEKQVYGIYDIADKRKSAGQGKARVLKRTEEALKELLDNGHLAKWTYDETADMFSWTYSSKIIKHKELLPVKEKAGAGETRRDGTPPELYTQNDKLYTQNDKLYTQNDKGFDK